MRIDAVLHL